MTRRSNHQRYSGLYRCVANRTACIWMTEIKQHVRVKQRDFITEISPGHNLNAFAFGDTNDRLPHTTGCADQRHANLATHILVDIESACLRSYGRNFEIPKPKLQINDQIPKLKEKMGSKTLSISPKPLASTFFSWTLSFCLGFGYWDLELVLEAAATSTALSAFKFLQG